MTILIFAMSPCFSHTVIYSPPKPSIHPLLTKSLQTVKRKKACCRRNYRLFSADKLITIVLISCYKKTDVEFFFISFWRLQ